MVSQCSAVCRIACLASGPVLFTVSAVVPEQVVFGLEGLPAPRYLWFQPVSHCHTLKAHLKGRTLKAAPQSLGLHLSEVREQG